MYSPAAFVEERPELLHGLIRDYPLGMLIAGAGGAVSADLIPFILYPGEGGAEGEHGVLRAHVARANPLHEALLASGECLVVFQGAQAYVSPSWYAGKAEHHKVVPTWNYAMVQARGTARVVDDGAWLWRLLNDLTAMQEAALPQPWQPSDAPRDFIEATMKAIVGIEIPLASLSGKWTVSQNRNAADRAGVVQGLRSQPGGQAVAALVAATLK
jgi:transcriptional regulator